MSTALVAGATGYLGRHVAAELHRRGHRVRVIARDRDRAEAPGPWGAPSLTDLADEWAIGEVTDPRFSASVAEGVDHVVSALGVTRQKADPWEVDNLANLAILQSAQEHGAGSFTYVNVLDGDQCPAALTRAKSAFAQTLTASAMTSQVVNPPGYFSDMMEILAMARRGVVPLLRPSARINPIHGADLARFTVDRLESSDSGSWDVGGPDVLTWSELAATAFRALDARPRTLTIPVPVLTPALRVLGLASPRLADTAGFTTWGMTRDTVGPPTGTHHLEDFFVQQADSLGRGSTP